MGSRFFTVWRFIGPSSGEVAIVAKHAEPNDLRVQHEYQRVLCQVWANTKAEALAQAARKVA